MNAVIERVLLSEEQILAKVSELAEKINEDYRDSCPVLISILRGSFIFMADLVRRLDIDCIIEFMAVSSYGQKASTTGAVKITKDVEIDLEGREVLLIEDILDSGLTLNYLMQFLNANKPAGIKICTLLNKPARRKVEVFPDYSGFIIPDEFVVGYGLDYADRYRNLPYIGVLKKSVYEKE